MITQQGIFRGRTQIPYNYSRYGYTRGNGKTWHGGVDLVGLDDTTILMPFYKGKAIRGTVTRARMVVNRQNKTSEWGWYVCVKLDDTQTPDAVNYLYFCHCDKLIAKLGQKVTSGTPLGIMGNTGNAAGGYKHCHLEVRATADGKGLDPTAYAGAPNAVGVYGTAAQPAPAGVWDCNGPWRIEAATGQDKDALRKVCEAAGLKVSAIQ